ncbi:polysaccharide biosynthesis family protein [Collimonas arenae]|uniref:Polysaccharide biosynthesis family protein n=1 Tax=Collimonas arenae TaxID=279058 RepID=A0A127QF33_9BURK|nr:flippase [Collimonas arenae]AMP08596.1 polysaccharide biosynthesis family protein [Collimonas arenae]
MLRFFFFNLLGNIIPMPIALICVPVISRLAGVDRLGALGIVWALVGYFSFLDFGLSRVVTRRVAHAIEKDRLQDELSELRGFFLWWAIPLMLVIALVLLIAGSWLSHIWSEGPIAMEIESAWVWIAWCVPVTLATNWFRGMLEGMQQFGRLNVLRVIFGSWNYAAPAIIVFWQPNLEAMIIAIVLGRFLALIAHVFACLQVDRQIVFGAAPRKIDSLGHFFREGGWMTVSNVISPLMVYFDRFLLATMLPARAIAWYVVSLELMMRTTVIPAALASVLFPKFSGANQASEGGVEAHLYERGIRIIASIMLPVCAIAVVLSYEGMKIWMGESFAINSYRIVEIIAVGIFVNSVAQLPFAWVQGTGRSHLTARLHFAELPMYMVGLYFAAINWGILGAAWMWTIRVSLDCIVLLWMGPSAVRRKIFPFVCLGGVFLLAISFLMDADLSISGKETLGILSILISCCISWFIFLPQNDRKELVKLSWSITKIFG